MKLILSVFMATLSFSATAYEVCTISPLLSSTLNNRPVLDVSCTNQIHSKSFINESSGSFAIEGNNLRSRVVKYLLDLGYSPIDSTTFKK